MQKIEKQLTNTNTNKNSHNFSQTTDDGDNKQNDIDNENKNGSVIIDETEQYEYNSDQGIPAINETKHWFHIMLDWEMFNFCSVSVLRVKILCLYNLC